MKILFLILCGILRADSLTLFDANFNLEVPGTNITALTVTANQYWVKNDQGASGASTVAPIAAFGSNGMSITPTSTLWFSDGNTKTSYSDVTLTVRASAPASNNERIWFRIGDSGATTASFFHNCYACYWTAAGNLALEKWDNAAGGTNLSVTAAGDISGTDHVYIATMFGSNLKCSISDGSKTYTAQASDSSWTTGGIGAQCYSVPHYFDDFKVTQFVTPTPAPTSTPAPSSGPSKTKDNTRAFFQATPTPVRAAMLSENLQ